MSTSQGKKALWVLLSGCLLGCVVSGPTLSQSARDDVPAEYAELANPVDDLPPDRIRYFEKKYKAQCARCHGIDGRGKGKDAAERRVPPRDFTDAAFMATRSDGELFYQILTGGGDRSAMPAYGPRSDVGWSEEKIWGMVRFVRIFTEGPAGVD
ncbi:MAG: cytochrome c [bacterium]|nr:cytochrome c [bacterium]MCP5071165.1 cytochrome c [bacterium]